MKLALGSDHAGFGMKESLKEFLQSHGHELVDVGTNSEASVDYPDFAKAVGDAVLSGETTRGILLCGSGVGASVAANKMKGIRAGLCHDVYSAGQAVEHDDINILVLGARVIGIEVAKSICKAFLEAEFSGEERHERRLKKIQSLEA